ncbi:UNVERIFIED_CONTAM: putative ribonuclease H protein [Sesamum latifolium]|uniref:Ribonuclease H protein n=1 Tax=Sesamum latifolium TaxID=2727402 RepID=A0AAW2XMF6_9LAMI
MLVLWSIWTVRNSAKHRGAPFKASSIIFKIMDYLQNISKSKLWRYKHMKGDLFAADRLHLPLLQNPKNQKTLAVYWRKPDFGWYKLNTDGASKGNPGVSGAGELLRDYKVHEIFSFLEPLGHATNILAGLQAFHRGLQICLEKVFTRIWVEVDANHIIHLISKHLQGASYLQTLLHNIRSILAQLEIKISHIYREGNQAADHLANLACNNSEFTILSREQQQGRITGIIRFDSHDFPNFQDCVELVSLLSGSPI